MTPDEVRQRIDAMRREQARQRGVMRALWFAKMAAHTVARIARWAGYETVRREGER